MPPFRLIATDLDGTLLNSEHRISPLTDQALREAIASGVLFTVATGKTFTSTMEWIRQYDIRIPVICGNGTLIHQPDGSILYENPIAREVAIEGIRLARTMDMVPIIYAGHQILTTVCDENMGVLMAHHEPNPIVIPELESALEKDYQPHKLVLMNENDLDAVSEFQHLLEQTFAGRAQVIRSGLASIVELLPLGATKGEALALILDHLDIPAEQTICFGDNCNDLDMIQRAGIGVAMGHAPDDILQRADYVTGTNDEDGVGWAIRKFVLTPYSNNGHNIGDSI